jgi:uncharacterized Zn-binding protein involved in type VI secretion
MKKGIIALAVMAILMLPLFGCSFATEGDMMSQLLAWLADYKKNGLDSQDSDGDNGPIALKLTYPAGRSPLVFTTGWIFGSRCTVDGKDYSDQVKWSGTGSFEPNIGNLSRPSFNSEGSNTITLTVTINGKDTAKSFNVNAKSPALYACVGMRAKCDNDAHGCMACPHTTIGPITTGSSHVLIKGRPAARTGDIGVTVGCCGPGTFTITGGDQRIIIDGRPAVMIGDATRHCGGVGRVIGN